MPTDVVVAITARVDEIEKALEAARGALEPENEGGVIDWVGAWQKAVWAHSAMLAVVSMLYDQANAGTLPTRLVPPGGGRGR